MKCNAPVNSGAERKPDDVDDVIAEFSGRLTGVYQPDELRLLREEWDRPWPPPTEERAQ